MRETQEALFQAWNPTFEAAGFGGPATRIRALEGNHRLHRKCEALDAREKRPITANAAIVWELSGWCWTLAAPLQLGEHMSAV